MTIKSLSLSGRILPFLTFVILCVFFGGVRAEEPRGKLVVFHAGSLAIPFRDISKAFIKEYPEIRVEREAAGSRTCARKITDLRRPCDVMASADYTVIQDLLFPLYADWNICFATNEMAIMYRPDSRYSDQINRENWYEILLREGVEYGHSDPHSDPCGYRSQLVWQLAERYYGVPGLYGKLRERCPIRNVRPKETDLIAMLEVGQLDYVFIYRSICEQQRMPFIELPDEINLRSDAYRHFYEEAKIRVTGKIPGKYIVKRGRPMVYGITVPKEAPNQEAAIRFVAFVVGPEGQKIMRANGQPPISPPRATGRVDLMPPKLKELLR